MPPTSETPRTAEPERCDHLEALATSRLLALASRGERAAVNALFTRYFPWLRSWSRRRLPRWARSVVDTSDLVQDVLMQTFTRLATFEAKGTGALRAYLRTAVDNRIRDEMRKIGRRPHATSLDQARQPARGGSSPLQQIIDDETWNRYLQGLNMLSVRERRLIVGRMELEYTYKQLAAIDGRSTPDAARMALKRALKRLSEVMPDG